MVDLARVASRAYSTGSDAPPRALQAPPRRARAATLPEGFAGPSAAPVRGRRTGEHLRVSGARNGAGGSPTGLAGLFRPGARSVMAREPICDPSCDPFR